MNALRSIQTHPSFLKLSSSPHLSWFAPAFLVDWLVVLVILPQISHYIEQTYPFERDVKHYIGDPYHSWPHIEPEQVPGDLLVKLGFWLPLLVMVIVGALRQSVHEVHNAALALWGASAIMRITIEWIKNRVGRLRPDFWARCAWDASLEVCTGPAVLVKDGRRSFPSGHSATAFSGLFFLALFLAGKNGAFALHATFPRSSLLQSRLLRFSLAVSPLFLAAWVAMTRIEDNYHHLEDVVVGSSIGIVCALSTYLVYFYSPFDSKLLPLMDKPKMVYGAEEEPRDLGMVALAGEAEEGLLRGDGSEEA